MHPVLALFMLLCCASVAGAQSTFVSGSLVGEIARFDFVESPPAPYYSPVDISVNGEAVGFGLSIERALGDRWGVALEFVKPGTIGREDTQELPISILTAIFPPLPPVEIHRESEQKRISWNTMAWLSQDIGSRVELAYFGGISFTRTRFRQAYNVVVPALVLLPPEFVGGIPTVTRIEYKVDPIVGLDARIRLSDRFAVVPGLRFQGAGVGGRRGWILRPSAGVRWGF